MLVTTKNLSPIPQHNPKSMEVHTNESDIAPEKNPNEELGNNLEVDLISNQSMGQIMDHEKHAEHVPESHLDKVLETEFHKQMDTSAQSRDDLPSCKLEDAIVKKTSQSVNQLVSQTNINTSKSHLQESKTSRSNRQSQNSHSYCTSDNNGCILTKKENILLLKIRAYLKVRYAREIDAIKIRSKVEKLGYSEMIPEMRRLLTSESWRIGRNFLKDVKRLKVDRCMVLEMTNYAIQEILFRDPILKAHMLCSVRTRISFEQDFRLKEQCFSLQDKPFSFFEIPDELHAINFNKLIKQLEEIESYDTPAQMRKVLLSVLRNLIAEMKRLGKNDVTADDLLPIIIYILTHANQLQNPLMTMEYMQQLSYFKGNDFGESAYSLLLFQSALAAIQQNLLQQDVSSLSVNCDFDSDTSFSNEENHDFQNLSPEILDNENNEGDERIEDNEVKIVSEINEDDENKNNNNENFMGFRGIKENIVNKGDNENNEDKKDNEDTVDNENDGLYKDSICNYQRCHHEEK